MILFVDTSALYAIMVSTDDGHAKTSVEFRKAVSSGRTLATTSYVLVETLALLQHRFGLDAVLDLDNHILPLIQVEWVTRELHDRGMRKLKGTSSRGLSLVDCVSFEFMHRDSIREALALDRHFRDEGFRLVPTAR